MQPFRVHTGIVAPLDRANVDTDAIIPKQFLKSIRRAGFGVNLFDAWRYVDHGEPGIRSPTFCTRFAANDPLDTELRILNRQYPSEAIRL